MDENNETPQITNTDSITSDESQLQTQNTQSKVPLIIGAILLLLVGGGAGWYFSQASIKENQQVLTPSPTVALSDVSPTKTMNSTVTSDVKQYSNEVLSLNYPAHWVAKSYENSAINFYDYNDESTFGPNSVLNIFLDYNFTQLNFEDPVGTRIEVGDKLYSTKLENVTVSGVTAMQIKNEVGEGSATDGSSGINTIIPYEDAYLFISLKYGSPNSTNEELDKAYKAILNSISLNK